MRSVRLGVVLLLSACSGADPSDLESQVVSLYVTHQRYDDDRPWAKSNPMGRAAFATVVEGPALLTLAQMVSDSTLVQVERFGNGRRWDARVVHSDPEINLALLTVDDTSFFEGLEPVRFAASLPREASVRSIRWQSGQLETTESRIARAEVTTNRYGNIEHAFLRARTDLSDGGWSEPVFHGAEFAGLTSSQDDERRAAIIPPEILRAYVDSVGSGAYRGFASLGVAWQSNRDGSLAAYLGLEGAERGILVRSTRTGSSACGVLQPKDVLLALDGHEIDAVRNYDHPVYGRIRFTHIAVNGHHAGDVVVARVLRDGAVLELPMELRSYASQLRLIPWRRDGTAPPYLVAGGLVFRELDGGYIRTWGEEWSKRAPFNLAQRFFLEAHSQTENRRRIIVLSSVLPDAYNLGYHDVANRVVERVNGVAIDSIADVEKAFSAPQNGFQTITLAATGKRREIVLDAARFQEATQKILADYGIPQANRREPEERADLGPECGTEGRWAQRAPDQPRTAR